ncbi:MAG: hypothetical protein ACFB20_09215 [Opitutales bacterium]
MPSTQLPITTAGPLRFHLQHQWARLPADLKWGNTHGLAQDKAGHLYVAHTVHADSRVRDAVVVLDPQGNFVRSFGAAYDGSAHGLELFEEDGTEYLYLTDLKQGLFKLTLQGEVVWHFAKPEMYRRLFGLKWCPTNVAAAPGGDLYLADGYGTGFIIRIDRHGNEMDFFGGPGKHADAVTHPHGLFMDTRGAEPVLLVAENLPTQVRTFSLDGTPLKAQLTDDGTLEAPRHFTQMGEYLIVPDLAGRVAVLDAQNALVGYLGDAGVPLNDLFPIRGNPSESFTDGQFVHPHDVLVRPDGSLLVAEWVEHGRLTLLTPAPN